MKIIYNKIFLEHDTGMHPENRKRLESLGKLLETDVINGEKYLGLMHTKKYIEHVKKYCSESKPLDRDTFTSKKSYQAAIYAVGATIMASESNDFALVRPPGHHAFPEESSGFCIFNNIAIAVKKLVDEGKRVLIVDFDSHLGDGTVKFFYDTDRVLYWSIHQYPAFPGGGYVNEIGEGKGKGYTICVPLPPGSGDEIFADAIESFLPVALQFKPDVVACSAGFDGHHYDLLLDLRYSLAAYYKLGKILGKNFDNIFATLEGGYNIEMFPKCLKNFIAGVNGEKLPYGERATDSRIIAINEFEVRRIELEKNLRQFWKI
ncbi:MAG: histone deacetylase [Actinomycetota bacterium]|nr:histone deacetylase [Actinomycetota bacterium]